ncbi:enoyl-CoA hydratase-related protein [Rhodopseudomonas pseudopalustris]|uniref:Enoyl-CoA hydratase n=1 Tax=Rhodopseudomonas pseudopalustris TaxID=1513892 RepID=A0A1H8X4G6_9BRAD|nr:enoyl-CoA hydratase-related protein [Rhodopseudomonas pseudopalustris]SEP34567.1 enoyl-CoA hydratase [Rhodopseudomonas pseudopalustris]
MTDWKTKYKLITFDNDKGVLTVSFSREAKLNAVDARMHTEMSWLWGDVARDEATRAVVLTGAGAAFSAGGDLDWFKTMTPDALDRLFIEARRIIVDMLEVPQPIIAAVNGAATGLGATLALMSDIIYASEKATIADTHVLAGIGAGDGGVVIWPWLCGMARAKEYLMTGQKLNAREAHSIGLVNHVVAHDELLDTATRMARRLADGPQLAIRGTKFSLNKILREAVNLTLDTSLSLEKECFHSADHRECIDAFLEKRKPQFNR